MGRRYDTVRQCAQIRVLIEDNKYTKALEQIDRLPLENVSSIMDLYLFADLYEKAERLEMTKRIYYIVYERTRSRCSLYRLLRLVIRLGDLEEAGELFLAYEVIGGVTLDTFELRYRLAKAEGAPRSVLIEILEDLKKEEYTEEWGYQLALLYEMEGMREACIQECKDLKLWFGEGVIINKAVTLRERCESVDWEPPADEEIPEPEIPETEAAYAFAAPQVSITELEEMVPEDTVAEESENLTQQPENPIVPEEPVVQDTPIMQDKPAEPIEQLEPEKMEQEPELLEVEERKEEPMPFVAESVSEPVVVKRAKPLQPQKAKPVESLEELLEKDPEDVSENGIRYRTLKSVIRRLRYHEGAVHFVFAGGEERITLAVAKRVTKELNNVGYLSARSVVKITAEKLNALELAEQAEKLMGGCMLVTDAAEMTKKTVDDLTALMEKYGEQMVVMLAGDFDEMDCFLSIYKNLADRIEYKVRM